MTKLETIKIEQIPTLAQLASEIWHQYWPIILSEEQINYMVKKFQSEKAILSQISDEQYTYYFIKQNDEIIGYTGISEKETHLFLSKLYIKKDYRNKGVGRKVFEEIKNFAIHKNYKNIILTVNKYNEHTIKAYSNWGFKIIDSVVTDIGNGFVMDDYIMKYELH